jgi:CRP-like cAMP-binding protein
MALSAELSKLQIKVPKGEIVFSENDLTRDLYVLLTGKIEVYQKGVLLAVIEKQGSFFGEMAMLSGQARTATIKAIDDSIMLKVPSTQLTTLVKHMPDLTMRMAKNLAMMVNNSNKGLLMAWEATEFKKMIEEELQENPGKNLADTVPQLLNAIRSKQRESQVALSSSYLRSSVFIQPFCHSIESIFSTFYPDISVKAEESLSSEGEGIFCKLKFSGVTSGNFIYMIPEKESKEIGRKLFGENSEQKMIEDVLLELVSRIMRSVNEKVPGLNMEIDNPEIIERYRIPDDDFFGIYITSNKGFLAWVELDN